MRTWDAPVRLTRDLCAVRVIDNDLSVRWVYVPWRNTSEPLLSEAINAACDRIPESPWKRRQRDGR